MIINCEKCDTRFNLDDSRIPADGVKVRCSRCKHAFFVQPEETPGASDAEAVADLAHDAVADQASAGGETQTLEQSDDRTQMLEQGSVDFSARSRDDAEEESDWEFNEDPAEHSATASPQRAVPESAGDLASELSAPGTDLAGELAGEVAPTPAREPESLDTATADPDPMNEFLASESPPSETDGLSLEDLGSPEEWDLLGSESRDPATEPEPEAVLAEAPPASHAAPTEAHSDDVADEILFDTPPAAVVEELPLPSSSPRTVQTGAGFVAWGVMLVLLGLAGWGSLVPPSAAPNHARPTLLGDLRVDGVEARIVENAVAGPLYVVSGELHNPGQGPSVTGARVLIQLLDGSGAALAEPPVPVGVAPSEASLRMEEPELLLARQGDDADALARTTLAPGESIAIAALLPRVPGGARGFRLELGSPLSSEASPPSPLPNSEPIPNRE